MMTVYLKVRYCLILVETEEKASNKYCPDENLENMLNQNVN